MQMKFKRIIAFMTTLALIFSLVTTVGAAVQPEMSISITSKDSTKAVTAISKGEIIKVSVSISNSVDAISIAVPSLHFNPDVVKVCDASGNILESAKGSMSFFQAGDAIGGSNPEKWRGSILQNLNYPAFNNSTGLIRMSVDTDPPRVLSGKQEIYSLYMKAVALGYADIRFSQLSDGDGKPNPTDYFETSVVPLRHIGDLTHIYATTILNDKIPLKLIVPDSTLVTPDEHIIYMTAKADDKLVSQCAMGEIFTVDFHIKNVDSAVNIYLPVYYDSDKVTLIAKKPTLVPDVYEDVDVDATTNKDWIMTTHPELIVLSTQMGYPTFDTENGYLQLILDKPSGYMNLEGENTILCSLRFRAKQTGTFKMEFARWDNANGRPFDYGSPEGSSYRTKDYILGGFEDLGPQIPLQPIFEFEILREKSKKPDLVEVKPNTGGETATVIVSGVEPDALVTIYGENGNQIGVPIRADENGTASFSNVPLDQTTDDRIWADALEDGRTISDKTLGVPEGQITGYRLIEVKPLDLIVVNYGTLLGSVPLPTTVDAKIGHTLAGSDAVIIPNNYEQLPLSSSAWENTDTYKNTVSDIYDFFIKPTYPTGLPASDQIKVKQQVFVRPSGATAGQKIVVFISEEVMYGQPQILNSGEIATAPTPPEREGYVFEGWYTEDGTEYDFDTPVTAEVTILHAKFREDTASKKYWIRGNLRNGNGAVLTLEGLEVTYTIDGGTEKTVTSGTDGAYEITDIPHGSEVKITPPPAPTNHMVTPEIRLRAITANTSDQDFTYVPQTVIVNPPSSGGSSGGSGYSTPATSPLHIRCIHEESGEVLYTQTVERIVVGTEQTVNAPDLEGYELTDETPKKIKIVNSNTANVVEFKYSGAPKKGLLNDVDHYRYIIGYDDGEVKPEREITREEVAAIFYRLLKEESRIEYRTKIHNFPDVNIDRWSIGEIATMANMKIVLGYDDGFFYPAKPITRAEFATIAMRFDILIENATHGLTDISGHWAERYIASAYQIGWVDGYEDGSFLPNKPITRTEAAKLINRVLKRRVDQVGLLSEIVIKWPDLEIEHWGYYELMEATISHDYERRYEDRVMENWTGKGTDMYFATDDIPTPTPDQLPPYQPSPVITVWTEPDAEAMQEPEIISLPEAYVETPIELVSLPVPSETVDIAKDEYEELLRILAIQEQEEAIRAAEEAEAKTNEKEAKKAETPEMVTLTKEEYEELLKAVSTRIQKEEPQLQPQPQPQSITITHTVVLGDTLYGISKKYGMTIAEIKALNGLTSDVIQVGKQLIVK